RAAARSRCQRRNGPLLTPQRISDPVPRVRGAAALAPQVGSPTLLHRPGRDLAMLSGRSHPGSGGAPKPDATHSASVHAAQRSKADAVLSRGPALLRFPGVEPGPSAV